MKKPIFSIAAIVAFIAPYISVASGLIVAWLFVHFHWLGVFHVPQSQVATAAAGMVVFAITSILHYAALHFHALPIVLTNLQRRELALQSRDAKATTAPGPTPPA